MTAQTDMNSRPSDAAGISIGGGEVGLCLTRLHHNRYTEAESAPDAVTARLIQRGFDHEALTVETIKAESVGIVAVVGAADDDPYGTTARHLASGADVILGGRIAGADGTLVGAPDVLVKLPDGYAPVEIKGHFVIGNKGPAASVSVLQELADRHESDLRFRSHRRRDLFQVAHYWRILDSIGYATPRPIGGVIGTDSPIRCHWVDLDDEADSILSETIDRTEASLEAIRFGSKHPLAPLEAPWWRGECGRCEWNPICYAQLESADDPTLLNRIGKDQRAELAVNGIQTIADIAALDPADERVAEGSIVFDARARVHGGLLRRADTSTALDLPTPPRQIDFDIETYGGRIYLAGFLLTEEGTSRFDPVVDWVGTEQSEREFVLTMFERLANYADSSTTVYHWTDYERVQLVAAGRRHGLSIRGFSSVDGWFDAHAVDLYRWTKEHFVSPAGFSLKAIAPLCGFAWRDDDPGGLQSEIWYEAMLTGDEAMKQRILEYNEDDVAAQLAIRRWVTGQDAGDGPGSTIPSSHHWPIPG